MIYGKKPQELSVSDSQVDFGTSPSMRSTDWVRIISKEYGQTRSLQAMSFKYNVDDFYRNSSETKCEWPLGWFWFISKYEKYWLSKEVFPQNMVKPEAYKLCQ